MFVEACITFDDFLEKMSVHVSVPSGKGSWFAQRKLFLSMTFVRVAEVHCINPAGLQSYSLTWKTCTVKVRS
jgi:hypothetical protein